MNILIIIFSSINAILAIRVLIRAKEQKEKKNVLNFLERSLRLEKGKTCNTKLRCDKLISKMHAKTTI